MADISIINLRRFGEYGWAWEERRDPHETYTRFRTNGGGEGLFEDRPDGLSFTDRQILGTGQFSLRGCTYRRAYGRLYRALLRETKL